MLKEKWDKTTQTVFDLHSDLKKATAEYGEFKTLSAQESDWLERLEKRLKKSLQHSAADAEEISEELDDIENFLNNHPEDRLPRLEALAEALKVKGVIIEVVDSDVKRLKARWVELAEKAKHRTDVLEGQFHSKSYRVGRKDTVPRYRITGCICRND